MAQQEPSHECAESARGFKFQYGKVENGNRVIDSQFATRTLFVSTTLGGNKTMFGVNFPDGRIKSYPAQGPRNKKYYVLYVRENPNCGKSQFKDNGEGKLTMEEIRPQGMGGARGPAARRRAESPATSVSSAPPQ